MSETPSVYETKNNDFSVATAFALYQPQVAEVSELELIQNRKRSPIVRDAIDLYSWFERHELLDTLSKATGIGKQELVDIALANLATMDISEIVKYADPA